MITHLKFASVACHDQAVALKFWTEKVGFHVVTDQPMGDQRWIELAIGDADTRLVLFTPDGHGERVGGFFNGSFACDDVEATYRQLSGRGVTFKSPPQKAPWGTFTIFVDDEGNEFVMGSR
jgi:predicted enzyme related to lactoylglutathione lyase